MLHKYLVTLIILLFTVTIYSQSPVKFGIFAGISNPVGDFGDNSISHSIYSDDVLDEGPGYAKLGFAGGIDLTFPLGAPGLGWYSSAAVIYNPFDEDAIRDMYEQDGWDVKSIDVGNWMNIQIASGLNYTTPISPAIDFLVLGQVALTFVNPPSTTVEYAGYESGGYYYDEGTEKGELESATSFGFVLGTGLVFSGKFNVSLKYLSLGEAEMDASYSDKGTYYYMSGGTLYYGDYNNSGEGKMKRSLSTVLLTVGMTF